MRILVVKLSSIGDIVHTLPAVAAIRAHFPEAEISWAVDARYAEILRDCPAIDNLIEIDLGKKDGRLTHLKREAARLRKQDFDIAIDFQGLLKSAFVARISGAPKRWGFAGAHLREPASRIFLTDTAVISEGVNVIHENMELAAKALEINLSENEIQFPIATNKSARSDASVAIDKLPTENFALLNPGGGWVTKLWPARNFGLLADLIWNEFGIASLVTSGPGEEQLADEAVASSQTKAAVRADVGLKGFYELASKARVYVGGDTGPTHIAVAARAPIVGLFGPTEWWRNGSLNPDDICVERNDISCREDCHRRTCSKWICMDIDVETVFEAVKARLAISNRGSG